MLENRLVKGIFGKRMKLTENSALPGTHKEKNSATNMLSILTTLGRIIYTDIYGGRGKKGNEKKLTRNQTLPDGSTRRHARRRSFFCVKDRGDMAAMPLPAKAG